MQILVFPEGSLYFAARNRTDWLTYAEEIPAVFNGHPKLIPCNDSSFDNSTVLQTMSCLAQAHSMHVVINMAEVLWCETAMDLYCPQDGRYHFNTDVVFGDDGSILARYRKSHLAGTYPTINQPAAPSPQFFDTNFGVRFGVLVCADMQYRYPAFQYWSLGVRDLVHTSTWVNTPPFDGAVMLQQAFSRIWEANLIAANNAGSWTVAGGGIFHKGEPLDYYFTPADGILHKLTIADVPIIQQNLTDSPPFAALTSTEPLDSSWSVHHFDANHQSEDNATICQVSAFGVKFSCIEIDVLSGSSGQYSLSANGLSCTLRYRVSRFLTEAGTSTTFVAYAWRGWSPISQGTPSVPFVEACGIVQCFGFPDCAALPYNNSHVLFDEIEIEAKNVSAQTTEFPMLSVKDGQILPAEAIRVEVLAPGAFKLKTKGPLKDPLYAAHLFGYVDVQYSSVGGILPSHLNVS